MYGKIPAKIPAPYSKICDQNRTIFSNEFYENNNYSIYTFGINHNCQRLNMSFKFYRFTQFFVSIFILIMSNFLNKFRINYLNRMKKHGILSELKFILDTSNISYTTLTICYHKMIMYKLISQTKYSKIYIY